MIVTGEGTGVVSIEHYFDEGYLFVRYVSRLRTLRLLLDPLVERITYLC